MARSVRQRCWGTDRARRGTDAPARLTAREPRGTDSDGAKLADSMLGTDSAIRGTDAWVAAPGYMPGHAEGTGLQQPGWLGGVSHLSVPEGSVPSGRGGRSLVVPVTRNTRPVAGSAGQVVAGSQWFVSVSAGRARLRAEF
jgi:hypothetical protein